ncbi:MAG: hypothetical protein A2V79_08930 [Betaproteobacteria bacterium RBG_16_56_24]|nr:MAG: hypothetical protein A2V79_08930 [Betaproteobacteria bacterium RBG_16_56_24]
MNILPPLLAITLLLASSFARAEDDSSDDLRYCLELKSDHEIAKCAGEISAGSKGRPFSKEEVDKILSEEQASVPINANEPPGAPATDSPVKDLLREQDEENSN